MSDGVSPRRGGYRYGCEERPVEAHEVNVTGAYNVLRLAREAGVRRLVMASSREVYGEVGAFPVSETAPIRPKNVYGASKAAGEMYCSWASSSMEVTVLRLSNVFGSGDTDRVIPRFLAVAGAGQPLVVYGGGQILEFVWIDTVVQAFIRVGLGSYVRRCINIGSGAGITILETARRVIKTCRSTSDLACLPARQAEVSRFIADVTRMTQDLGIPGSPEPLKELGAMCDSCQPRTAKLPDRPTHAESLN